MLRRILTLRHFVAQRIVTAAVVMLTSLFAAREVGIASFGTVAFYVFLTKTLLVTNLGSISAYILHTYRPDDRARSGGFLIPYLAHLLLVSCLFLAFTTCLDDVYGWAVVAFILMIPLYAVEPVLRVRRKFYVSLIPDLLISASIVGSVAYQMLRGDAGSADAVTLVRGSLVAIVCLYPLVVLVLRRNWGPLRSDLWHRPMGPREYVRQVGSGFSVYLGTIAFTAAIMVDRYFLEKYDGGAAFSLYMLSFQLATGAMLVVSSQNFINAVDIGEALKGSSDLREVFSTKLKHAAAMAGASYLLLLIGAQILERFFLHGYEGLTRVSSILGLALMGVYVVGSVDAVVFYCRRQAVLTGAMMVCFLLALAHNLLCRWLGLAPISVAYFTAGWLCLYALFGLWYSRRMLGSLAASAVTGDATVARGMGRKGEAERCGTGVPDGALADGLSVEWLRARSDMSVEAS